MEVVATKCTVKRENTSRNFLELKKINTFTRILQMVRDTGKFACYTVLFAVFTLSNEKEGQTVQPFIYFIFMLCI